MDKSSLLKIFAGAIIVAVGALLLNLFKDYLGVAEMLLSALVALSFFAIYFGFLAYNRMEKKLDEYKNVMGEFEKAVSIIKQRFDHTDRLSWVIHEDSLLELERNKKRSGNIWVINPDPSDDTGKSEWVPVIQNNVKDGSIYTYISPNRFTLSGAIKGLKTVFRNQLDKCKIVRIPEEEFRKLPFEHLVVYDPDNQSDEIDCFAELIGEERGWWFRIPISKRNEVIGILTNLTNTSECLSKIK